MITETLFLVDYDGSFVIDDHTGDLYFTGNLDCCKTIDLSVKAKDQGIPSLDSHEARIKIILFHSKTKPPPTSHTTPHNETTSPTTPHNTSFNKTSGSSPKVNAHTGKDFILFISQGRAGQRKEEEERGGKDRKGRKDRMKWVDMKNE